MTEISPLDPVPDAPPQPQRTEGYDATVIHFSREELQRLRSREQQLMADIASMQGELAALERDRERVMGVLSVFDAQGIAWAEDDDERVAQIAEAATTDERESGGKPEPDPHASSGEEAPAESESLTPDDEAERDTVADQRDRVADLLDEAAMDAFMAATEPLSKLMLMRKLQVTRTTATKVIARLHAAGKIQLGVRQRYSPVLDGGQPAPAVEPESAGTNGTSRRGVRAFTDEQFRDAIRDIGKPFNGPMLADYMAEHFGVEVHRVTLGKYIREATDAGRLTRTGGKSGPSVKYVFVKPNPKMGPSERPRTDGPHGPRGGAHLKGIDGGKPKRGETVAHTGRAVGRSDSSIQNKRKRALGFRVKSQKG